MGLPIIQLVAAFGRQMSRPIARRIIAYAREHPYLRNRILIPTGKRLHAISFRLRIKSIGLVAPSQTPSVSDAQAIEMASETLVEALIYMVTVVLLYIIYRASPEKANISDLEKYTKKNHEKIEKFEERIMQHEEIIEKLIEIIQKHGMDKKNILVLEKDRKQPLTIIGEKMKTLIPGNGRST